MSPARQLGTALSSLDGSLTGPLAYASPNVSARGLLYWSGNRNDFSTQYGYAVEDWPCVDFVGTPRAKHDYRAGGTFRQWRLIELSKPNRLRASCSGIYPDGWTGASTECSPGGCRSKSAARPLGVVRSPARVVGGPA